MQFFDSVDCKKLRIGSYVWLFLQDFQQTEIDCWNSICLLNQLEQFLVSFAGKNVSTLRIFHVDSWGCRDDTLLLCKTCLHAVYHRPMVEGRASQTMGHGSKWGAKCKVWGCHTNWLEKSDIRIFVKFTNKIESRLVVNIFLLHFYF